MPEIRQVVFSPQIVEKIWETHGLLQWDVENVVYGSESEARWDNDPVHGIRVIVRGLTGEASPRLVFVALRPIDPETGVWACLTAFVPTDASYGEEE
ncbi:MAG: hypothetical protein LC750_18140 [Actinobacteria bacterium]|nr:hypothetical protein [Actinomycetota bacterium]